MQVSRATALSLMVIAPVLWSTAGVVTRHVEKAAAYEQAFWRSLFCFGVVAVALIFKKQKAALSPPILLSGALWAVMFTTFVLALSLTSTANTLVVMSLSPLLTALLAWLVLREAVALRTWIAAGASAAGIAWMAASAGEAGLSDSRDIAGMLVALSVPIASAVNLVTLRAASARGGRVDLMPAVMLGGLFSALVALPFALPLQASARDLGLLAFLGVFQLALPCSLLVIASRVLPPPEIALLALLEVVLGVLWTWLFAGETPGGATLLGGGIVLLALAFNEAAGFRGIMQSKLL
jgi:drug/metabolite transporter (DMT)-like permease